MELLELQDEIILLLLEALGMSIQLLLKFISQEASSHYHIINRLRLSWTSGGRSNRMCKHTLWATDAAHLKWNHSAGSIGCVKADEGLIAPLAWATRRDDWVVRSQRRGCSSKLWQLLSSSSIQVWATC
jgi:hypothetical protein